MTSEARRACDAEIVAAGGGWAHVETTVRASARKSGRNPRYPYVTRPEAVARAQATIDHRAEVAERHAVERAAYVTRQASLRALPK